MKNLKTFLPIVGALLLDNPYKYINTLKSFTWRVYHLITTLGAMYFVSIL